MMRLVSISALASATALVAAAILAATMFVPVSAASLTTNLSTGHVSAGRITGGRFGNVTVGSQYFRPNSVDITHGPKNKLPVETDHGCHSNKTSIWRCWPQ